MKNKVNYSFSVLIGMTVMMSVTGLPDGLFNQTRTTPIFGVATIILITVFLFPMIDKCAFRHIWKDLISICFLSLYLVDFMHLSNLWNLGCLCLLILFALIRWAEKVNYVLLLICCVCSVLWLAGWGYLQYLGYLPPGHKYFVLTGPFHNPAILAVIISLILGILINVIVRYYAFLKKHPWFLVWLVSTVIFCVPVLLLFAARAAYVALLVMVLYGLGLDYIIKFSWRKRLFSMAGMFVMVLLSVGVLYAIKPQSAKGRILIWKVSCRMIKDNPLWGCGKGGFAANYLYYQAEYMKSSANQEERRLAGSTHLAFNEPLRVAVEQGLVGLLIYIGFVIWILFLLRERGGICVISRSLLAGIVTWGLFAYPDQTFPVLLLLIIGVAGSRGKRRARCGVVIEKVKRSWGMVCVAVCCFAVVVGEMLYSKYKSYHDLQVYLKSYRVRDMSDYAVVVDRFRDKMTDDISFVYFCCQVARAAKCDSVFLHSLYSLERSFPTPGVLMMKGDYWKEKKRWTEAEAAYRLAAEMVPSLQMPRGRLAFLYNETGRRHEAFMIAREILTEEVKVYGFETFTLHRDLKRIFEDELK